MWLSLWKNAGNSALNLTYCHTMQTEARSSEKNQRLIAIRTLVGCGAYARMLAALAGVILATSACIELEPSDVVGGKGALEIVDTAALKDNTPSFLASTHHSLTQLSRNTKPCNSSPQYILLDTAVCKPTINLRQAPEKNQYLLRVPFPVRRRKRLRLDITSH